LPPNALATAASNTRTLAFQMSADAVAFDEGDDGRVGDDEFTAAAVIAVPSVGGGGARTVAWTSQIRPTDTDLPASHGAAVRGTLPLGHAPEVLPCSQILWKTLLKKLPGHGAIANESRGSSDLHHSSASNAGSRERSTVRRTPL
jgi:hypothetical protein